MTQQQESAPTWSGRTTTKAQLVGMIAGRVGIPKVRVEEILHAVFNCIGEALCEPGDRRVEIRGWGVWETYERKPKVGRDLGHDGSPIALPARTVVRFRPGTALAEAVACAAEMNRKEA